MTRPVAAAAFALLAAATATAAEPPDHPALQCRLVQQQLADGAWRLQLRLHNAGSDALELRPGAQLALYTDAGATDSLPDTARAERLQQKALLLAAGATRTEVLLVDPQAGPPLRCAGRRAPAAALYFYRFEHRPLFRCRLEGWSPPPAEGCAG